MNQREIAFNILHGKPEKRIAFFPDISDWFKARKFPQNRFHQIPTGSYIPDDWVDKNFNSGLPNEFVDWTYLDFYRNFHWGLPVHIYDWYDLEYERGELVVTQQGDRIFRQYKTPFGTIQHIDGVSFDGSLSPVEYFVKQATDWKILKHVIEFTKPSAKFQHIAKILTGIGDLGIADLVIWRSPFGKILHEYAGLATTVFHLMDEPERIQEIMEIQTEKDIEVIKLAAKSAAEIIIISDHADEQILNPNWYETYCLPFYHRAIEILHSQGKLVSTHLDGNFKALFSLVRRSGFDYLDGCTPAPMTNYQIEQLPQGMSETMKALCGVPALFFVNDNAIETILSFAEKIIKTLPNRVILNIGDILPVNGNIFKAIALGKWANEMNQENQA